MVRDGKGGKDRVTMLAAELVDPLRKHLEWVRRQHERDLADGYGEVWLPGALAVERAGVAAAGLRPSRGPGGGLSEVKGFAVRRWQREEGRGRVWIVN